MRHKVIWSFLSLVALATGGLAAGCDSDAKLAKSAEGDSCTKTSDCDDGLRCEQGTCFTATGHIDNSAGAPSGSAGEPGVVGPPPPVLGGPGESCTKRADCEDGLSCLSQRCTEGGGGGEGGASPGPGPMLGGLGETCTLTSDCGKGFVCLPGTIGGEGFTGVGVCEPVDNGLVPSGNACGAECKTAADCCELPVAVHVPYAAVSTVGVSGPYGTGANSCTELAALLDGVDCATTKVAAQMAQCFAQTAYCECTKTTWTCSDAGRCEYNAACVATAVGSVPGGCPSYTRTQSGLPLTVTCNKAKKCAPEAVAGCKADKDCDAAVLVADSQGTDTCANGKCACDRDNGLCFRACTEDLDCPVHFTCDVKAALCRGGHECDTDSVCVTNNNDVNSKCIDGTCQGSCDNDLDCNSGRLTSGIATRVCNAEHVCEDVGCASDDECPAVGGVRTFCTKAVPLPTGDGVASAVTD